MSRTHTRLASASFVASLFGVVAVVAACGARGPLDDDGPLDGASNADVGAVDAAVADTSPETPDAPIGPVDAAPEGGSIIGCGTCLVGQCSQGILACVQDPGCQKTLQCVVTTCLSSGTPDPTCLFTCASGDVQGALKIFNIFTCVTGKCGADCNPLLTGVLGGLGGVGGGGSGGGPPPPPKSPARTMSPFAEAMSRQWPQLCAPISP
jgi:hypothetical protein